MKIYYRSLNSQEDWKIAESVKETNQSWHYNIGSIKARLFKRNKKIKFYSSACQTGSEYSLKYEVVLNLKKPEQNMPDKPKINKKQYYSDNRLKEVKTKSEATHCAVGGMVNGKKRAGLTVLIKYIDSVQAIIAKTKEQHPNENRYIVYFKEQEIK